LSIVIERGGSTMERTRAPALLQAAVATSTAVMALIAVSALTGVSAGAAPSPSYPDEVMADGPAGYWRLGETSGTVAVDRTANNSSGLYKNGVVLGVPGALETDPDKAARFDGGNDLVEVADPASGVLDFGTDDFTTEAWVKTAVNDERGLFAKKNATASWAVTVTDDPNHAGQLRANFKDGVLSRQLYSTRRVDDGAWHHVVVRWQRDTGISFYIDAQPAGSGGGTMPGDVGNTAPLQIGKSPDNPYLNGDVDEVAVYRSLLSPARIEAHYAASRLDDSAPQVTLESPVNGSSTSDTTPSFTGAAGSAIGDDPTVSVDLHAGTDTSTPALQTLEATRNGDGSFSVEAAPALDPGSYTARARQSDLAGNVGHSAPTTFTVEEGGTPEPPSPVVVAAGDIAGCGGTTSGEFQTAALVEGLPNATVLTLGDNAYPNGTAEEFANCYHPNWGRFKDRTRPIPGGHDYNTPGAAGYYGYFGAAAGDPAKGWYSYDLGQWHVLALNAVCTAVGCGVGSEQEEWLRQDLADHPTSCTLALLHEPRFSSGAIHGGTTDMQPFWEALYDHGAEVVLSGDDHLYERFLPQTPDGQLDTATGITQFVVGTGGFYLYDFAAAEPNSDYRLNTTYGVIKMTLHPNSYSWKFLRADGASTTDSGSADCHGSGTEPPADTTPPETTITDAPPDSSSSQSASFSFSSSEPGSTFECRLDAGAWAGCLDPHAYSDLAAGSHTFEVRATDALGHVDPTPAAEAWTIESGPPPDTTPPATTIVLGTSGTVASDAASFSFSSSELGSTFECRLDGGAWAACSSPRAYSGLPDGSHTFEVRATDAAGNVDPDPAAQTWTADTTGPDTTITSGPSSETTSSSAVFWFMSPESSSAFDCRLDNDEWASCTSPKSYSSIKNGMHMFQVRARDALGNVDPTPATVSWKVKK
jgi:hypothetical protein